MPTCFFVADLHGIIQRYDKLLALIVRERPDAVFLGGDLLSHSSFWNSPGQADDFLTEYLLPAFWTIREALIEHYPEIFLILGNDDARSEEKHFIRAADEGLWKYVHEKKLAWRDYFVYGYAHVPPTPFLLKDWERYDVSRHVPPGCVSPEDGIRTVPAESSEIRWSTIQNDLSQLTVDDPLDRAIFLFHAPPAGTALDRAALDGRSVEGVPLDLHVGSVAVKRFIEERQPLVTLHGHVHESARLTGEWKIRLGETVCLNAAHDGQELSLVRFDPAHPEEAVRELV